MAVEYDVSKIDDDVREHMISCLAFNEIEPELYWMLYFAKSSKRGIGNEINFVIVNWHGEEEIAWLPCAKQYAKSYKEARKSIKDLRKLLASVDKYR